MGGGLDLGEHLEDPGQHVGGDAVSGIPHPDDELLALGLRRSARCGRPSSVYLAALFSRLHEDLLQPGRVRVDRHGSRGSETVSSCSRSSTRGGDRIDRPADDDREVQDLLPELDLALRDAGDVEQVLDQAG